MCSVELLEFLVAILCLLQAFENLIVYRISLYSREDEYLIPRVKEKKKEIYTHKKGGYTHGSAPLARYS